MKRETVGGCALFAVMLVGAPWGIWTYDWRPAVSGAVIALLVGMAAVCAQPPRR